MKSLAIFLLPALLSAQITHVRSTGTVGSKISLTSQANDLLVVLAGCSASSATQISDSAGNAWHVLNPSTTQAGEGGVQSWYSVANGTATTISISGCSGSWKDVMVDEFSGVNTTTPVDINAQSTGSGTISRSLVLSGSNELVWCGALGTLASPGSGFSIGANDNSEDLTEYQVASGSTVTVAFPNSGAYIALMAAFVPAAAIPQPPVISLFTATPSTITAGAQTTLSWATSGASSVSISGIGSMSISGSTNVSPAVTTLYTLTATNAVGSVTAQATVTVQAALPNTATLAAGAISCVLTNNSGGLTVNCSGNGLQFYTGSAQQSLSPALTLSLNYQTDALTIIAKPDGNGGWSWDAAANDVASNGTL